MLLVVQHAAVQAAGLSKNGIIGFQTAVCENRWFVRCRLQSLVMCTQSASTAFTDVEFWMHIAYHVKLNSGSPS
jgi:hypothetical protein